MLTFQLWVPYWGYKCIIIWFFSALIHYQMWQINICYVSGDTSNIWILQSINLSQDYMPYLHSAVRRWCYRIIFGALQYYSSALIKHIVSSASDDAETCIWADGSRVYSGCTLLPLWQRARKITDATLRIFIYIILPSQH